MVAKIFLTVLHIFYFPGENYRFDGWGRKAGASRKNEINCNTLVGAIDSEIFCFNWSISIFFVPQEKIAPRISTSVRLVLV